MNYAEHIMREAGYDLANMISLVGPEILPKSYGVDYSFYEFDDGSGILYTEDPDGMVALEVDPEEGGYPIHKGIARIEALHKALADADVVVYQHCTITTVYMLAPWTDKAQALFDALFSGPDHTYVDGKLYCEHGYVDGLIAGLRDNEGLVVKCLEYMEEIDDRVRRNCP